ncbi:MAG: TIGR03862 family flavoprotein [Bacteriovoracia bacterium]
MEKRRGLAVGIVGSGPAGLMAATAAIESGGRVTVFEKRPGLGRKLLIAGSSGLNITNGLEEGLFAKKYEGGGVEFWEKVLSSYSCSDWLGFIEKLGLKTFLGTSNRYFVEEMKSSRLLKMWSEYLESMGVTFRVASALLDFNVIDTQVELVFKEGVEKFDSVVLCLGGASYEEDLTWPKIFELKKIKLKEFEPANVGFRVSWSKKFLDESLRKPLKNISYKSKLGEVLGDLMITEYGIEGTPVYTYGCKGVSFIDLKPDMSFEKIKEQCLLIKENLSPIRRIKKKLNLSEVALSLLFHETPKDILDNLDALLKRVKKFPIELLEPQPIAEAISTKGGVCFSEVDENLMLKKYPGVFIAGEMLDWNAPTGGFLIQGCVSQGYFVGKHLSEVKRR